MYIQNLWKVLVHFPVLAFLSVHLRHAKRTTVSIDDVKMCCRRSPTLLEFITQQADKQKASKDATVATRKRAKKKQREEDEPHVLVEQDDDA